jgi:hypothetical protein
MRHAILLLPDVALVIVLCRMAFVGLARERAAMFTFLCAWLAFSLSTLILGQAVPHSSELYARIYLWLIAGVALVAVPALYQASRHLVAHPSIAAAVPALAALAAGLVLELVSRKTPSPALAALAASSFAAVILGAVFFCAAWEASPPDLVLRLGVGGYLLAFGFGLLLARLYGRGPAAFEPVAVLCAAAWLALAWFLAPTPDALVNDELLALSPFVPAVRSTTTGLLTGTVPETLPQRGQHHRGGRAPHRELQHPRGASSAPKSFSGSGAR